MLWKTSCIDALEPITARTILLMFPRNATSSAIATSKLELINLEDINHFPRAIYLILYLTWSSMLYSSTNLSA